MMQFLNIKIKKILMAFISLKSHPLTYVILSGIATESAWDNPSAQ